MILYDAICLVSKILVLLSKFFKFSAVIASMLAHIATRNKVIHLQDIIPSRLLVCVPVVLFSSDFSL